LLFLRPTMHHLLPERIMTLMGESGCFKGEVITLSISQQSTGTPKLL